MVWLQWQEEEQTRTCARIWAKSWPRRGTVCPVQLDTNAADTGGYSADHVAAYVCWSSIQWSFSHFNKHKKLLHHSRRLIYSDKRGGRGFVSESLSPALGLVGSARIGFAPSTAVGASPAAEEGASFPPADSVCSGPDPALAEVVPSTFCAVAGLFRTPASPPIVPASLSGTAPASAFSNLAGLSGMGSVCTPPELPTLEDWKSSCLSSFQVPFWLQSHAREECRRHW